MFRNEGAEGRPGPCTSSTSSVKKKPRMEQPAASTRTVFVSPSVEPEPEPERDPELEPHVALGVPPSAPEVAADLELRIDPHDGVVKTRTAYKIDYRCAQCSGEHSAIACDICKQEWLDAWELAMTPKELRVDPEDGLAKNYGGFMACYGPGRAYDIYVRAQKSTNKSQGIRFKDASDLDVRVADAEVKASHYRTFWCRKVGNLSVRDVEILTNVTFLTPSEIKQVELVFERIVQDIEARLPPDSAARRTSWGADGHAEQWERIWERLEREGWTQDGPCYVNKQQKRFGSKQLVREHLHLLQDVSEDIENRFDVGGHVQTVARFGVEGQKQTRVAVKALSTEQLRTYLPEFSNNVFFDRLVRVFSETGEQMLTMLELIDLYSALSPRAPKSWKCKILFCVYDFDEVRRRVKTKSLLSESM